MADQFTEKIFAAITKNPGQTARELGTKLGIDKKDVNSALYGPLKTKCRQDEKYRWHPISDDKVNPSATPAESAIPDTPFGRLCHYYLACLGRDEDGGISVFAANKYGDLDYHELAELPSTSGSDLFDSEAARRMMGRIRSERGRLAMYLGYPSALKQQKSKKSNWEGYFLEPILLFPIDMGSSPHDAPRLEAGFPIFNRTALRRLSNAGRDSFLEELLQLERDLGLTDVDELPELDEIARRLEAIRPEWSWKETINPDKLPNSPCITDLNEEGIYNRAVLVVGDRSPFTQGLEAELKQLSRIPPSQMQNSVLGQWLESTVTPEKSDQAHPIIEVLPLNSEQRQAIKQAMTSPLTIITGPPGTGKSQVVTDLLINAAWYGKRVLFASKNNKAVDVVESRVNNIGPRPILLRVGSNQYQTRLAEYLLSLLAATSTQDDIMAFNEANEKHNRIELQLAKLAENEQQLIDLRNKVDQLDQSIEDIRKVLSENQIQSLKNLDLDEVKSAFKDFRQALSSSVKENQGILTRIFWGLSKKERFSRLHEAGLTLTNVGRTLDIATPKKQPDDVSIKDWVKTSELVDKKIKVSALVQEYLKGLAILQSSTPLEAIAKEQAVLLKQMSDNAERLWNSWLRIQPSKLNQADRQLLQKYSSLLKMVIETGSEGTLEKGVYTQYRDLFPKVAHLLPCWAVTSLSARGKVPFEPGFFDLVVFDEASQCDIASALPLLYRAKRAVIIGDPKQLAHISGMPKGQDQQLLQRFDLVENFPHWAYSYNSLFDLATGFSSGQDIVNLRDHHRSHADIIEFSNQRFYEGRLRVATRYNVLNRPPKERAGVRWVDVPGRVLRPRSGGAVNEQEAAGVIQTLRDLILVKAYRGSIGVVSPFRAQANLIRELALADNEISNLLISQEFLVDTVHKFQGDERDVMIFSPVVSEGITPGAISFLKNNGNLFNVAITRARAQLIVVGDRTIASQCEVEYLAEFAKYVAKLDHNDTKDISIDVTKLGPDYPSVTNPESVSDWERHFYKAMFAAGIKALPQYSVEKYALDFAVFSGKRRLNIEVDGERYHRNWTGELCRRDQIRNLRMIELGWDVMRFWVYEIRDDLDGCIKKVSDWVAKGK